ncbi:cytochrome P450 [Atractiella rhizophila]|nr:cytochrome P450 [Atractiella rhizophila]
MLFEPVSDYLPSNLRLFVYVPLLFLLQSVLRSLYIAFLGPLSKVPGPFLCKITGAVDAYQTLASGRRSPWIYDLHQKYGPAVRISPTLVSINDPSALKQIYGGKFLKSNPRYFGKHMDGTEHMLVLNEFDKVKARRGILLPLFNKGNLEGFEPELHKYTNVFLDRVEREMKVEGSADFFRWMRLVAFDIICQLAYGLDMKMTETGKANKLVELMEQVYIYFVLKDFVPGVSYLANSGIYPKLTDISQAERKFVSYGEKAYADGLKDGSITDIDDGNRTNLLESLHRASLQDKRISRKHVATEAGAIMIAGSDTTSTAMTYACWELARRLELQDAIRTELRSVAHTPTTFPSGKDLESLPLFNGFLKEILRLWPTLPGPLERSVPNGGAMLGGKFLPEGTEVTMQAYDIHRDRNIFPDPLALKPERWENETAEMKTGFIPFSYGPRNCVGMNLAWLEMRVLMGALVRRFYISLHPGTDEESMHPEEHFFVTPKAMACRLQIRPVEK